MKNSEWWQMSKIIANVTLADRTKRRQFISGLLAVIIALFAIGIWPLDSWLTRSLWRMLVFWGFVGAMCFFMTLLALFDALAVIGEERRKLGLHKPLDEEESSSD